MGSFNRDGVKRRLVEVLAAALGDRWDVSYEWPGDDTGDRWLYFGAATDGSAVVDSLTGSPGTKRHTVDTFNIIGVLCSQGHLTVREAEQAAADAMRTVDDTLRRLKRLDDPSDVIPVGKVPDTYNTVRNVDVATVDGPEATRPQVDDDGLIDGMCAFTLTCVSDL